MLRVSLPGNQSQCRCIKLGNDFLWRLAYFAMKFDCCAALLLRRWVRLSPLISPAKYATRGKSTMFAAVQCSLSLGSKVFRTA
jgi:hypothetical protein